MEDTGIRVGTFNVGQGLRDYNHMCAAAEQTRLLKDRVGQVNSKEEEARETSRITGEEENRAAEVIAEQVDVLCLQELMSVTRPFPTKLTSLGFTIVQVADDTSTAIAYRPAKFKSVTTHHLTTSEKSGIYGKDVAVVKLSMPSGRTLAVASLHSNGFKLYEPRSRRPKTEREGDIKGRSDADAYNGQARAQVASLATDYAILAGDMNNNPENYGEQFSHYDGANYRLLRTGGPTNINGGEPEYSHREIDFLFLRETSSVQRVINYVRACFVNAKELKNEMRPAVARGFAFKHNENCSDHLPLVVTVKEVDVAGSKLAVLALAAFVVLAAFGTFHLTRSSTGINEV